MIVFLIVNTGLWLIWATINRTDTDHLWRAWVTGIWLIVLMFVAFKMYGERPISDQRISEEVRRMQGR